MDTVIQKLDRGWHFHLGDCDNAWYRGYDDHDWMSVSLPHDWAVMYPFEEKNSSGTGYLPGGIGWYRIRFQLPKEMTGKRVRVHFDGVYKNSQVWCNSYYLGKRPYGYVPFSYDISEYVSFGDMDNEISVKVTHTDIADSRWYTGSGITRMVSIIIEEVVHPEVYGCFFQATPEITNNECCSSQIEIQHTVVNSSDEWQEVTVKTSLFDSDDKEVFSLEGNLSLAGEKSGVTKLSKRMDNPKLWSIESPYLYRMKTWYEVNKECYLVDQQYVGIRKIEFDPNKGFSLNGISIKLKGVCVHHDGGCLGAAMVQSVWQRRLEVLKECGCNAIRCSHNPHMPELYYLCDSMGFVMIDEAFDEWENAKNKWSMGHNVYPPKHQGYYEDFPEWHERDLRAMIQRDRNHPSVIIWSVGNEIDYPNDPYGHPMFSIMTGNNDANKPEAERQYDTNKPNMERLSHIAAHLEAIVEKEDDSRPATVAAAYPELSTKIGFIDSFHVVGYNYKEHLYEESHKDFPQKTFLGTENGHSYSAWRAVTDHDYICGQFLWTGIDYLGEAKGWPIHGSSAGIITTAGMRKPEFYRRKSFWDSQSTIHIATKNAKDTEAWAPMSNHWNYETGDRIIVKCYVSYAGEGSYVTLLCNNKLVGKSKVYEETGEFVLSIDYISGELEAKYFNSENELICSSKLFTTGNAQLLKCYAWEPDRKYSVKECQFENGIGDLIQVLVSLTDHDFRKVTWDNRLVSIEVIGPGEFYGMDNGDLSDNTPFAMNKRRTHNGELVAYVKRISSGTIKVIVRADLEKPTSKDDHLGDFRYEIQVD